MPAAGFDTQLRPFAPIGLAVTVEGRWKNWQGPVGCGPAATQQQLYYLEVVRVVEPDPIAAVTLTPGGQLAAGLLGFSVQPTAAATTIAGLPDAPPPALTPIPAFTFTSPPAATATPPATWTPVATAPLPPGASPTATPSPPPTATPLPLPTATPAGPTAAPTDGPSPTPTATNVPGTQGTITSLGGLDNGRLEPGQSHRYAFSIATATELTVTVATSLDLDAALAILDPAGNPLVERNLSPAGQPEQLRAAVLPEPGVYFIVVSDAGQTGGYYTLMLLDPDTYRFEFQPTLAFGEQRTALILPQTDHFWSFEATAGERIRIVVTPGDTSDLFFELYGVDAAALVSMINQAGPGGPEELLEFELPATGFYALRVGELAFGLSAYTIRLDRH